MGVHQDNQRLFEELNARDRRPQGVMIQVSAKCNLGCLMCGYVGRTPNVGFISTELFQHVLDDCQAYKVPRIYMETAWGEPMLHPEIFALIEMARGFEIVLSTNITPLNARRIMRLAQLGIHTFQLSFCGYDRESYEATYRGAKFDHVVQNLQLVRQVFSEHSPETKIIVNGVTLKNDLVAVSRTIMFLKTLGFRDDQMEIKLPNNFGGFYKGSPIEGTRGIHTFKDLRGRRVELCTVLLDNPAVYVDGRVTACGCLDNSGALVIGDIRKETLRQMRYGSRYEGLLRQFLSGDISQIPLCSTCDVPYCSSRMVTLGSQEPVT